VHFALSELGLSMDELRWDIDFALVMDLSWASYEKNTGKKAPWTRSLLDRITDYMMEA
jgi:hypothetical protein